MTKTVGINLTWLVPNKVGGSEEHLVRLIRALSEVGHDDLFEVRLYARPELIAKNPDFTERFNVVEAPSQQFGKASRIALENSWLNYQCRNDDLVHHGGGAIPLAFSSKPIVTIHDLQPLEFPENFTKLKSRWLKKMIPYSAKKAVKIFTPSQFTKSKIVELLDVPHEKISVISHGSNFSDDDDSFTHLSDELSDLGDFIFYPAISYAHKRHVDILYALTNLDKNINVVFCGAPGPKDNHLRYLVEHLGLGDRVKFLGRVDNSLLYQLYRSALMLVFPSSYEGFGNPIIEAMHYNCPVVCSDAGALPEVAGGAAEIFPCLDQEALVRSIRKVTDKDVRADMIDAGIVRADQFSQKAAGEKLIENYLEVLNS